MNIADVVIILLAVGIMLFGVIYQLRKRKKAKKEGTTYCNGCSGCASKDNKNCRG